MRPKDVFLTILFGGMPIVVLAEQPPKTETKTIKANRVVVLHKQIEEMIQALDTKETKEIIEFIQKYALIDDLQNKEMTKQQKTAMLNDIAELFQGKKQTLLQQVLIVCRSLTPTISKDQKTYTFSIEKKKIEDLHTDKIIFVFHEERNIFLLAD